MGQNRNAYLIVKEFVDSPSEQARRNAITALTVLDDPDALRDLVQLVLNDPVPSVRECAEQEIACLPAAKVGAIVKMLHQRIAAQTEDRYRAYAVLGRLRSHGVSVGTFQVSLLSRIRLAKQAPAAVPLTRRAAAVRNLWASCFGGIFGCFGFLLILWGVFDIGIARGDLVFYSCLSVGLGIVVAVFAPSLGVPIGVQADRVATLIIEFLTAMVMSVAGSFFTSLRLTGEARRNSVFWCLFLMLPASAIATRGAMLLAMRWWGSRDVNLLIGIGCGTAAGILALSAVPIAMHETANEVIAGVWMAAVPIVAAVAAAYAVMDNQERTPPLVPAALHALGFVPLLFLVVAIGRHSLADTLGNDTDYPPVGDAEAHKRVELTALPGSLILWTSREEPVQITMNCRSNFYRYTLRTPHFRTEGTNEVGTKTLDLKKGSHYMWVTAEDVPGDVKATEALDLVADRWFRNSPNTSPPDGPSLCTLDFAFNPPKEKPIEK